MIDVCMVYFAGLVQGLLLGGVFVYGRFTRSRAGGVR